MTPEIEPRPTDLVERLRLRAFHASGYMGDPALKRLLNEAAEQLELLVGDGCICPIDWDDRCPEHGDGGSKATP